MSLWIANHKTKASSLKLLLVQCLITAMKQETYKAEKQKKRRRDENSTKSSGAGLQQGWAPVTKACARPHLFRLRSKLQHLACVDSGSDLRHRTWKKEGISPTCEDQTVSPCTELACAPPWLSFVLHQCGLNWLGPQLPWRWAGL